MHILANLALWLLLFVNLGRFQEIFPFLAPLQLGKVSIAFGLVVVLATNINNLLLLLKEAPIKNYIIALLLISFIGIPFSVYPGDALSTWIGYLRMLLTISTIIALAQKHVDSMRLCLICILLFISVQMMLQKVGGRISVSSTYDPNDIAFLCVTFLPIAISGIMQSNFSIKILSIAASGGAVASIALSGSRGGLLALVAITIYGIILAKKGRVLLIALCIMGGVLFSAMAGDELWQRIQELRDGTDYNLSTTGDSRLAIWTNALEIMLKRPIFGVGIGQFVTGIATLTGSPWKTAHNSFVQIGMELGVGGLYAFCAILFFIYRLSMQGEKATFFSQKEQEAYKFLRISLLGFCVGGFFVSHAYTPITYIFISFAVVMFFNYEKKENKNKANAVEKNYPPITPAKRVFSPAYLKKTINTNQIIAEEKRKKKKTRLEAGDALRKNKI